MKNNVKTKTLSWLLALAMLLSLVPITSLTAWAADPYADLKNTTTAITFDNKQWYLIDYDSTTVTLLSKECVGKSVFGTNNTYSGSTLETYVNNWYSENITADAKTAVADNKAFILESLNGINLDVLKCNQVEGTTYNLWWLCSKDHSEDRAMCVDGQVGYLDSLPVNWESGVRPVLKLDLSKVEFNSETKTFALPTPSAYADYLPAATDDATALAAKVVKFNGMDWYLIEDNSTSATEGTVTLFAKDKIGSSRFDNSKNVYSGSMVKSYLDNLTAEGGAFADVADAIVSTDLEDVTVTGAKLWLLSKDEVITTYKLSAALNKCSNDWWLRTPVTSSYLIYVNGESGSVVNSGNFHMNTYGVRPALNLDLSKVEFNSETKTFAVKPTVIEYRLWVGDVQVTGANMDDVLGDKDSGATVTFTPATTGENPTPATLTLKGATVTDYFAGVCVRYGVNDTLVINLEGDNTIGSDSEDGLNTGLETRGSLIIQGNGKLAVKGRYNGINCNGDITIESGEITASGLNSGIQSGNENEITLNGGKVTAKGNTGIAGYGGVTIAGADVNAEGVNYAIFTADKDITISAGTVNATATGANTWQKALNGTVKNSIYGTGWTDSSGTEGKTAIATSTTGQDLSDYKKVIFVSHTHDFTYSADGATITATCTADGCADPAASATLTIVAPALTTYGGTGSAAATLTGLTDFNSATGKTIAATDIKYVGRDGTTYTESTTAPTNAGKYTAKITVEEKTASVNYEIAKVNPTYTVPTGLTATCGQTLKDITLPTGWSWATNTQSVGGVGTNTFKATFTPTDTTNYNTISDIEVKVTVSKAAGKKAYINTDTMSYNDTTIYIEGVVGQEYVIIPKGTPITDSDWEKSIKPDSERENWVFFENLKEATEYEIYARTAATETAFASDAVKANVYTTLSSIGLDYDSTLVGATVKVMPEPEIEGLTYKWYQDVATEDDEGVIHHDLTEIAGAAGDTYTFRTDDIGKGITVKIFAGKAEVGEIEIEGPVTLTATVNFDSMGGSDVKEITDVEYRAKIEAPKDPIRKGYAFAGWYWEEEYLTPFDFQNDLITWENTTLYAKWTPVNYSIISVTGLSGANDNQWTKGTKDGVVITVKVSGEDNSFDHFTGVKLDGQLLTKDVDYTVTKGSTIVTLLPATLEKLSVGEHTVTVLFDNGEVNTDLTVKAANSGSATSPQTGDNSHMGLWIAIMILSLCALAATLFIGKKKRVFDR